MKSTAEHQNKRTEPTHWHTFSIFISSTYADIQAERDYRKQIVFPGYKNFKNGVSNLRSLTYVGALTQLP